jgi:hypothetical protein
LRNWSALRERPWSPPQAEPRGGMQAAIGQLPSPPAATFSSVTDPVRTVASRLGEYAPRRDAIRELSNE